MSSERDTLAKRTRLLRSLLFRVQRLRSAGVVVPQAECDVLARTLADYDQKVNQWMERDPSWKPSR